MSALHVTADEREQSQVMNPILQISGTVRDAKWAAVLKGMTSTPSATSAASRSIWGPSPPSAIDGGP